MEWGFRIATDARFGGGHFARCAALAAAFAKPAMLFHDPGSPHDLRAGGRVEEESIESAARAAEWLGARSERALVVDSYSIGREEVERASGRGFVAAFRDGGDRGAEHVSIDPNPGARARSGILGGPEYFPLPSRFEQFRETAMGRVSSTGDRLGILVAFGQRDSSNVTETVMHALRSLDTPFDATVALGAAYAEADALRAVTQEDERFAIRSSVADLAPLYGGFDLAIGAPGVSQFERACCGLPTILVPQNDRQAPLAAAWAGTGAAIAVPHAAGEIAEAVAALAAEPSRRKAMRRRAFDTVDGRGAERLAAALETLAEPA